MEQVEKEINEHFENYIFQWENKFYFLVGGYGSSKSYNTAFKLILKLLEEKRTALVVREVYETIRESCYSLLCEIVEDLNLSAYIKCSVSPLQLRFKNGSRIIFRGMDKVEKLKSINNVSLIWLEECSEIKYEGFKELLGRLRHPNLPLHMLLSTNPVSKNNWCYRHFFMDKKAKNFILDDKVLYEKREIIHNNTFYHHSIADDNLFLPQSYIEQLEEMKSYDKDLYRIARLGRFGINGLKVLPQFEIMDHEEVMREINTIRKPVFRVGMDFGFVTSYNALIRMCVDDEKKILYIYYEYYKNGMTDDKTAVEIEEFRKTGELIRADSAEPKTIKFYNQMGFRMVGAKKYPGSRLQNTKKVKRFRKIICSSKCINTIEELQDLTYKKDKDGNLIEDDFNIDAHTLFAVFYGLDQYEVADIKEQKYSEDITNKGYLNKAPLPPKRNKTVF